MCHMFQLVPSQVLDVNGRQDDRLADNGNSLMAVHSTKTSVDSDESELPKKQSIVCIISVCIITYMK